MEFVLPSIIGVIGCIISLIILHFSWISKLKWTAKIEETKANKELRVARIKAPRPKVKRMPKNWVDQIQTAIELLGNEDVQKLLEIFQGREEDLGENKILKTILELGQNFLSGYEEGRQQEQPETTAY